MLEIRKLDDKTYEEIRHEAIVAIHEHFGNWTDMNAHDPGITLIEMLSHLTEMQRYFIEQSAGAELLFPAIGAQPLHAAPAHVHAELYTDSPDGLIALPRGTPVYAHGVRYETAKAMTPRFSGVAAFRDARGVVYGASDTGVFFPFGDLSQRYKSFELLLHEPFPPGEKRRLSVLLSYGDGARNRPNGENALELAKLGWEYLAQDGFIRAGVNDETYGFTRSGELEFELDGEMATDENGYYVLRCTLLSHEYDLTPAILNLQPCVVRLEQRYGVCEAVTVKLTPGLELKANTYLAMYGDTTLFRRTETGWEQVREYTRRIDRASGEAVFSVADGEVRDMYMIASCDHDYLHHRVKTVLEGVPNQRIKLETFGCAVLYDSFELMVSEDHSFDNAEQWEKTDALHRSSPRDRHYEIDEKRGEIVFGDGFYGRIPRGAVMILSLSLTEGARGNIKAGQLGEIEYAGTTIHTRQINHATGGRDLESGEEALARVRDARYRAVTAEDYESVVRATPGLAIDRVSAYAAQDGDPDAAFSVTIAVKPVGKRAGLPDAYIERILTQLEPRKLAGTQIRIVPPAYVDISLSALVRVHARRSGADSVIEQRLEDFFKEQYSDFGAHIQYNKLFTFLDALPEVKSIVSLQISAHAPEARSDGAGGVILGRHCIACLGQVELRFESKGER